MIETVGEWQFGPRDAAEREVFAAEELRADVQIEIARVLHERQMTRTDLAKMMKCSPARISQLLGDNANLTLATIAKIFLALEMRCAVQAEPIGDIGRAPMARDRVDKRMSRGSSTWEQETRKLSSSRPTARDADLFMSQARLRALSDPSEYLTNDNDPVGARETLAAVGR